MPALCRQGRQPIQARSGLQFIQADEPAQRLAFGAWGCLGTCLCQARSCFASRCSPGRSQTGKGRADNLALRLPSSKTKGVARHGIGIHLFAVSQGRQWRALAATYYHHLRLDPRACHAVSPHCPDISSLSNRLITQFDTEPFCSRWTWI